MIFHGNDRSTTNDAELQVDSNFVRTNRNVLSNVDETVRQTTSHRRFLHVNAKIL